MNRVLVLSVLAIVLMASVSYADGVLSMLPATKTGIGIDLTKDSGDVIALEMVELASYKGVSANAGIISRVNDEAKGIPAAAINYNLGALSQYGVNVPYGNNIEVGLFAARDTGNRDWKLGPEISAKIKF